MAHLLLAGLPTEDDSSFASLGLFLSQEKNDALNVLQCILGIHVLQPQKRYLWLINKEV